MVYTEIKKINGSRYFYRVKSFREGKKFRKERIYLGKNLKENELKVIIKETDKKLGGRASKGLDKLKPKIIEFLDENGIKKAGVFGSYAVGKETKESDIDILIEPPKNMGFGFARLERELSKKLKKKVDLVSYNGLSPYLKEKILRQEVRLR
jgi:uncharacterized protein